MRCTAKSLGAATFDELRARLLSSPAAAGDCALGEGASISARDAILITYGDQLHEPDRAPLHTLAEFCDSICAAWSSGIHLLPFYPYSSDDGFSVIDYKQVNPALGTWDDVARVGQNFRLMFDGVINHISAQSEWFKAFLRDDAQVPRLLHRRRGRARSSQVVRPRALPLLTAFTTPSGVKKVWTTFSADQIDLNYANPDVLLDIIDVLLFYVAHGAEFIRLDAIAYLWKEIGTSCIHLPQTHRVIQLLRAILDEVAPHVSVDHRNQRAASGQHLVLWRRAQRSAAGLQLRAAAVDAAHVSHGRCDGVDAWAAGSGAAL